MDADGQSSRDTTERIAAAGKVRGKIKKQLLRLRISLRLKGRIVEATVIASLLYGCEVRCFRDTEIKQYQVFVNSFARYLGYVRFGTLRDMEGKATMTDVHHALGWLSVEEYIVRRQLQYLGHIGRYPAFRPEVAMIHSSLAGLARFEQQPEDRPNNSLWARMRRQVQQIVHASRIPISPS